MSGEDELRILHRDEAVVVVDKPSGMVVHTTRGGVGRPLLQRLRDQLETRVWPVHRLDAATSGAVLFALGPEIAAELQAVFRRGEVHKRYLALVRGVPGAPEGIIDHPVPNASGERVPARSDWWHRWDSGRYSLLEVHPRTGRRHQIRRHLKHMSWPIIGDVRYGKGEHNRKFRDEFGLCRLALHACALRLQGPSGPIDVEAEVPEDLRRPLLRFGVPATAFEPM